jgi:DNA-binding GntR family transcriptional regulator
VALNQTALAERAGVSRVSMGKALSRLHDEGLIQLGYGRIVICDVDAMRDWVAERNTVLPIRKVV